VRQWLLVRAQAKYATLATMGKLQNYQKSDWILRAVAFIF